MTLADYITIVIPTSPIPSHPSTSLIEMTIASIRKQLPDCQIIIQADGVRPEQEKFEEQYKAYKLRMWEHINAGKFGKCFMEEFHQFSHQAAMMKSTIWLISTPQLFYFEHDFVLLPEYVDWHGIVDVIRGDEANLVRLYYWSSIIPDHWHLMIDKAPIFKYGVPLLRTVQWSQHPHVASVALYKKILENFSDKSRTMIEDRIYPMVVAAAWCDFKCSIYAPMPYLKRLAHYHGREEEPKYEHTFTF